MAFRNSCTHKFRSTLAFAIAAFCFTALPGHAAETVEFESAVQKPSAFKLKQAKAQGKTLKVEKGQMLTGRLSRPEGVGPHPAVVLLHGCRGVLPFQKKFADALTDAGYVTLLVDSFTTRGYRNICVDYPELARAGKAAIGGRARDAFGAQNYLATLSFVDSKLIAVAGWLSQDILGSVSKRGLGQLFGNRFQAAVAFYPDCNYYAVSSFTAPVLILYGAKDEVRILKNCADMTSHNKGAKMPVTMKIFDEAGHGFDDSSAEGGLLMKNYFNPSKHTRGIHYQYSGAARDASIFIIKEFLRRHLK